MSDPTQNPPPDDSGSQPASGEGESQRQPSGQGEYGTQQPPPPPAGQGSYGTTPPPPPPPGEWQQPGAMPPPVQGQTGGVGQPADLLPRFVARLIDFVLLGFVNALLVSVVVVGLIMGANSGAATGWGMNNGAGFAANAVSSVVSAAIALGYFALMESKRGQTLGKMIMKLETRGPDGGRPTMEQALRRNAFTAIGVLGIIPFFGFLAGLLSLAAVIMIAVTINKDTETRRGWHDDFAGGTTVVKIG